MLTPYEDTRCDGKNSAQVTIRSDTNHGRVRVQWWAVYADPVEFGPSREIGRESVAVFMSLALIFNAFLRGQVLRYLSRTSKYRGFWEKLVAF